MSAGVMASCAAIHWGSRAIVRAVPFCDDPCLTDSPVGVCHPFEPNFEIKVTSDPSGHEAVWYRALVKNTSCATIGLHGSFFARDPEESPLQNHGDSYVSVIDASGREASEPNSGSADLFSGDGRIRPYRSVFRSREVIPKDPMLEFIEMRPNEELKTSQEALDPYRIRVVDRRTSNGVASVPEREPVPKREWGKEFAVPPDGYRRLTGYELRRGVRYSARLIFNQDCFFKTDVSGKSQFKVAVLSILSLIGGEPAPIRESRRRIRVESPPVEFFLAK